MPKSITTKNKKAIGIIIITIIGLAIVISQSSIQFRNNVLLAHYSKTPLEAYNEEPIFDAVEGNICIYKDIKTVKINDEYSVYLAYADRNKNKDYHIFTGLMKTKNEKYYFMGDMYFIPNEKESLNSDLFTFSTQNGIIEFGIMPKDTYNNSENLQDEKYDFVPVSLSLTETNNSEYVFVFSK